MTSDLIKGPSSAFQVVGSWTQGPESGGVITAQLLPFPSIGHSDRFNSLYQGQ